MKPSEAERAVTAKQEGAKQYASRMMEIINEVVCDATAGVEPIKRGRKPTNAEIIRLGATIHQQVRIANGFD